MPLDCQMCVNSSEDMGRKTRPHKSRKYPSDGIIQNSRNIESCP